MDMLLALILAVAVAVAPAVREPPVTMAITAIVRGGQAQIDQGNVVAMNDCTPSMRGCPVWLAGHRSTHGSVFAQVANLQPGDTVSVLGVRFQVTEHDIVCCYGSHFTPTADLTLQTSAADTEVHLVLARRL